MLKAVIFDMDGVIIDSEPMHAKAALLALNKYHIHTTMDYIESFIGSTTYSMCQTIVQDFNLTITPEELLQANTEYKKILLETEGYPVVPYVLDLIKDLHQHGIKLIIASSSSAEAIENVMDSLDIRPYFCGYVSGVQVKHPKPAPDIFIEAVKRLELSPAECLVIEDSCHGATAAYAANIPCVGFMNPNSGNQDLSKAILLVEGFEEVNYNYLNDFYRQLYPSGSILSTDQFIIRELTLSDFPDLYKLYQQPEIKCCLNDFTDDYAIEAEKLKAYIKKVYRYYNFGLWGVFLKESEKLIGKCGIELTMLDGEAVYEIGYLLSTQYQGKGYAQKFVHAVIDYCKNEIKLSRIIAIIDQTNEKSIKLATKVGFIQIGECIRNHHDCYIYEVI